ncbi:hypothetical protein K435DRAFT_786003 [Dendrothele bispora CBS 962.96]|uniref:Uncharacterized protein n=1 Tax=Dendrothele bispora (strain CBS 962.96) TaxID=1314807 RepID=A0A4S8KU49_DENBC|nr:hypothetical protein K435DRAFT_786003 [Dendrothele bispora CBS 962.96]
MTRGRPLSQDLRRSLIHMGLQHTFEDYWIEGHARHTRIMEAQRRAGKSWEDR